MDLNQQIDGCPHIYTKDGQYSSKEGCRAPLAQEDLACSLKSAHGLLFPMGLQCNISYPS